MSAPNLNVPEPLADDGDDITTALETAAIFNAQGDLREAARWVRRAAEAAGDAGNDVRALTLARAVADLNVSSSMMPSAPVPSAPAPSAPAPSAPASAVASSGTGSVRPSPVVRVEAAADAPAPPPPLPSATPAFPTATTAVLQSQPVPASPPPFPEETDEATPIARPSSPPGELAPPPALPYSAGNGAQGSARPGSLAAAFATTAPLVTPFAAAAPAAAAPPPAPAVVTPLAFATTPVAMKPALAAPVVVTSSAAIPVAAPPAAPSTANGVPAVFKAVRASVEATDENGVFRVKLLGADESASSSGHEALLVLLDPESRLLGG